VSDNLRDVSYLLAFGLTWAAIVICAQITVCETAVLSWLVRTNEPDKHG
jgi:hypothetical protein